MTTTEGAELLPAPYNDLLEQLDATADTNRQYGFHSRAELLEEAASAIRALARTSSPEAVGEADRQLFDKLSDILFGCGVDRAAKCLDLIAQHRSYRHPVAGDREAIARLLCEQDGHDPDGGPRVGYGYVNYLSRADAILAALSPKGAGE